MEVVNNNNQEQAPVTNEQKLQYENNQLKNMLNNMQMQMQQMNMVNVFKKLDFMFKVIESQNNFSADFVQECTQTIENDFHEIFLASEEEKENLNSEEAE